MAAKHGVDATRRRLRRTARYQALTVSRTKTRTVHTTATASRKSSSICNLAPPFRRRQSLPRACTVRLWQPTYTPPHMEQAVPVLQATVLGSVRPLDLVTSSYHPGIPSVLTLQAIIAKSSFATAAAESTHSGPWRFFTTVEQVSTPPATLRGRLREFFWHSRADSAQGHIPLHFHSHPLPTSSPPESLPRTLASLVKTGRLPSQPGARYGSLRISQRPVA